MIEKGHDLQERAVCFESSRAEPPSRVCWGSRGRGQTGWGGMKIGKGRDGQSD